MSQARVFQLSSVIVILVAMAALGCGKKDKDKGKDKGGADNGSAGRVKDMPPLSADAKKALAMFPKESVAVGGVNLAKARDSQLFGTLEPMLRSYAGAGLKALEEGCGLDPVAEIQSVVLAIRDAKQRKALVLIRGIERKVMSECIDVISAKKADKGDDSDKKGGKKNVPLDTNDKKQAEPKPPAKGGKKAADKTPEESISLTITEDGDYVTLATKDHEAMFMWLDDTTFFGGIGVTKTELEALIAGGDGIDQSAGFMSMVGKVDTTGGVWLVARETKGLMGMEFDTALLSIDLFGGLKVATAATFATPADAEATVGRINKRLDELRGSTLAEYMTKLVVRTDNSEARMEWELSDAEIAAFKEFYKQDVQVQVVWGIAKKRIQRWISPDTKKDNAGD